MTINFQNSESQSQQVQLMKNCNSINVIFFKLYCISIFNIGKFFITDEVFCESLQIARTQKRHMLSQSFSCILGCQSQQITHCTMYKCMCGTEEQYSAQYHWIVSLSLKQPFVSPGKTLGSSGPLFNLFGLATSGIYRT